jgi:hypothetical protein
LHLGTPRIPPDRTVMRLHLAKDIRGWLCFQWKKQSNLRQYYTWLWKG